MTAFPYSRILLFSVLFCPVVLALDTHQISDYQQRMNNPDPNVRLAALNEIQSLTENSPEKAGNDVVPFLVNALGDSDPKVRYEAVSNIAAIASQTLPRFMPPQPGMIDLRSYAPLKPALEKLLFDPDREARQNALGAYVNLYDLTPEVQAKLIASFAGEANTGFQANIVGALTMCSAPTPATHAFLTNLLDDPKNRPFVIGSFADAPSWQKLPPPPAAALPKMADMLVKEKDTQKRQALARAIGKYGAQARPYLGQIEQLHDKEADATTRANLKAVADAIRAGKPLQDQ
jgi:HEAT repeat protein